MTVIKLKIDCSRCFRFIVTSLKLTGTGCIIWVLQINRYKNCQIDAVCFENRSAHMTAPNTTKLCGSETGDMLTREILQDTSDYRLTTNNCLSGAESGGSRAGCRGDCFNR